MPKEDVPPTSVPCKEVQDYVDRLMAERPPLTTEQCRKIAAILNC